MQKSNTNSPVVVMVGQIPPPYTGQSVMIQVLLEGLRKHFQVKFVRMDYSNSVDAIGRFSFSKVKKLFSQIRATRRLLKKYPDAVLYYPPTSPCLTPFLRDLVYLSFVRSQAKHVIYHYHAYGISDFLKGRPFLSAIARCVYGRADVAVVPTPSCAADPLCFNPARVEVLPNGRDLPMVEGLLEKMDKNRFGVLFVGILTEGKGIFDLIETARVMIKDGTNVEFRCVGVWQDQREEAEVKSRIQKYNLQGDITFCGRKTGDDLWSEYRAADVFFFPTHYKFETQGMVVVEAMAFGLPVVASNWRGPCDVVEDGKSGFLCPPGSINDYVLALEKLCSNEGLRISIGDCGRKLYEKSYTEDSFTRRWVRLIEEVRG